MPAKRNGVIPNGHFRKDWQRFIKSWFSQPMRKKRRHQRRLAKAARLAPRPTHKLRPLVRCPSVKYNMKSRLGRGFSLEELKAAGIPRREAPTIGIAVDHRRVNKSVEALQRNVQRLKQYRAKLILFPIVNKKPRRGDASDEQRKLAAQVVGEIQNVKSLTKRNRKEKARKPTEQESKSHVYHALRKARSNARLVGVREKKKKEAAEAIDKK